MTAAGSSASARYEACGSRNIRPKAHGMYSTHLLSGVLVCGVCGAKMQVFTTTKVKPSGRVIRAQRPDLLENPLALAARLERALIADHEMGSR